MSSLHWKTRSSRIFDHIPFHTAFIDWDFEEFPYNSHSDQIRKWYEQSYRELTHQITELMELMYGNEPG